MHARGQRMGPYELGDELGAGGMGRVFRARHVELGRHVALKVLTQAELTGSDQAQRFAREARAAANLNHPGIVRVHEVGHEAGRPFIAMELVEGESLAERLRRSGPLPPRAAAALIASLARAVQHAHDEQILHRDLKPANVLLDAEGRARITDFGLAKRHTDERLTRTGQLLGTPEYCSPEQANGDVSAMGPASDVYGLGATLYATLTGRPPFREDTLVGTVFSVLQKPCVPPSRHAAVDRELEAICLRCLEKDPPARFPSAADLAQALDAYLRRESPTAARRALRYALPAVGFLGLGVAGLGVFVWRGAQPDPADEVPAQTTTPDGPTTRTPKPWVVPARFREQWTSLPPRPLPKGLTYLPERGEFLNTQDGSVMVWVPPRRFRMGTNLGTKVEAPPHTVELTRGFFIGKHEVSWRQFRQFCQATGRAPPEPAFDVKPDHPVHSVSWMDAQAYCAWAGTRLPTEAEWELAATGGDQRLYPWGTARVTSARAHVSQGPTSRPRLVTGCAAGASPFGSLNMLGNVWEWVWDPIGPYGGPAIDPRGKAGGDSTLRAIRGGGSHTPLAEARTTIRSRWLAWRGAPRIGFRVCRTEVTPPPLDAAPWKVKAFQIPEVEPNAAAVRIAWEQGAKSDGMTFEVPHLELAFGDAGPNRLQRLRNRKGRRDLPSDLFGVTAEASLRVPAGRWALSVISDDGVRVSLDGRTVIDRWSIHGNILDQHELTRTAAGTVRVRVEFFEFNGGARLTVVLHPSP